LKQKKNLTVDIKYELTLKFAESAGIVANTPKLLKNLQKCWWLNLRSKGDRSFGLTDEGYNIASRYITFYKVDFPADMLISNQTIIWLDRYIDCPYYLKGQSIFVSREKVAVQLILFNGDINRFGKAKSPCRFSTT
jgi:hypothetical protein